jgi:gamma-butyrobetaine dioxygenase
MTDPIDAIAALFAGEGMREYFGEAVSVGVHMLQAATLAENSGAPDHLVAAALLHDIGHVRGVQIAHILLSGTTDRHEEVGAGWLSAWFPAEVIEPVRLHVAAKRYLCAVEQDYLASLSRESACTLRRQGGPMSSREVREFEQSPHAQAAIAVRRWDEAAKDPAAQTPDFDHFRPVLERVLASSASAPR